MTKPLTHEGGISSIREARYQPFSTPYKVVVFRVSAASPILAANARGME